MKNLLTLRTLLPLTGLALLAGTIFGLRELTAAKVPSQTPAESRPAAALVRAEGILVTYPDARVDVAAETAGRVVKLFVNERDTVSAGQLLAEIDSTETHAALAEAQARVAELDAEISFLRKELERTRKLRSSGTVPEDRLDRAVHDLEVAEARRRAALSATERLAAVLAKAHIRSPIAGTVLYRPSTPGEMLAPGQLVATIADTSRVRIEAEVDEYDAGRISLRAPVTVRVEGYADRTWSGTVEEVPDEVVTRRLKPQDPGRPSDTRILLVKIALGEKAPIRLGQRVEVAIQAQGE